MSIAPDPVLLDISPEGVAVLLLNRPAKHNAFDEVMIASLADALETLRGADHVRIVFVRGAGERFCVGADLEWMRRQGERTVHENEEDAYAFARALRALHDLPQFTVALVHGAAMGGGVGLAAACDWAVAVADATFRFPEVRVGLIPAMVSPYVVEAVGPRTARGLFASAAPIDAERALRIGLVQEIAADERAMEGAMKRLAGLAMENAPGAVAEAKLMARKVAGRPIDDRIAHETAKRLAEIRAGAEAQEGTSAFLERRPPSWDGRKA
jgi:methylglutaconyl-CoA hydratase